MELCPKCKTLLRVGASKYILRDGKLFMIQEMVCRNDKCENNGQVVDTVEHELELSE